jgi:hypothetical protein
VVEEVKPKQTTPVERVIKQFGRVDRCIRCNKETYLHETYVDDELEGIVGRYYCKAGHGQGYVLHGGFADWYKINIKGWKVEKKQIEKEVVSKEEPPEVKVN